MPAMRNRGSNGVQTRRANIREQYPLIIILCEGEKTEPNYFNSFPYRTKKVIGTGMNTNSLVKEAIEKKKLENIQKNDHVWVVFDRDSFSNEQIDAAFQLADQYNIKCAFSNQAFELWYLLHYDYHDASLHRDQYSQKLTEMIGRPYRKNDPGLYNILISKQEDAIRNARRLYKSYPEPINLLKCDPVTTVYTLVEELIRLQNEFGHIGHK
jgi:hypothetical protein